MPAGNLLYYALVALVIALIAGFLGLEAWQARRQVSRKFFFTYS
jgi:hypothetical protein